MTVCDLCHDVNKPARRSWFTLATEREPSDGTSDHRMEVVIDLCADCEPALLRRFRQLIPSSATITAHAYGR